MQAEWARHPPVHHLVAAYLGYKTPVQTSAQTTSVEEMVSEFGNVPIRQGIAPDTTAFDQAMKDLTHG